MTIPCGFTGLGSWVSDTLGLDWGNGNGNGSEWPGTCSTDFLAELQQLYPHSSAQLLGEPVNTDDVNNERWNMTDDFREAFDRCYFQMAEHKIAAAQGAKTQEQLDADAAYAEAKLAEQDAKMSGKGAGVVIHHSDSPEVQAAKIAAAVDASPPSIPWWVWAAGAIGAVYPIRRL